MTLPKSIHLKIYKNKFSDNIKIILYTNNLKISFITKKKIIYYNEKTHSIYSKLKRLKCCYSLARKFNKIKQFFFFLICWKKFKIAYTGKGYRIRKYPKLNFLDFTFGPCHFVKAFVPNYKLKLKKKKCIIVYYKYPFIVKKNFEKICNIKPINLYTQRGLRHSKKIVYRKPKNKAVYV